jgi:hypothetical protein
MRPLTAEVAHIEWCITLVEHGKGLSFAFFSDIEEKVIQGRLKVIPLVEDLFLSAQAVMSNSTFVNPIIEKFILMVKKAFVKLDSQ